MFLNKLTWKRVGLLFLAFIVIIVGFLFGEWHYTHGQGLKRLHEMEAKLDAEDPGWRWEDIVAEHHRKYPPEEQTAMAQAAQLRHYMKYVDWTIFFPYSQNGKIQVDQFTYKPDPDTLQKRETTHSQLATVYVELNDILAVLNGAPRLMFNNEDWYYTEPIDSVAIFDCMDLLEVQACGHIDNERYTKAIDCIDRLLDLRIYAKLTPHISYDRAGYAIANRVLILIELLLARSDKIEDLVKLQHRISSMSSQGINPNTVRTERARLHNLFTRIEAGKLSPIASVLTPKEMYNTGYFERYGWTYLEKFYPAICVRTIRLHNALIAGESFDVATKTAGEIRGIPPLFNSIQRGPLFHTDKYCECMKKEQTLWIIIQGLLDFEIYHQNHGHWPTSLEQLSKKTIVQLDDPYSDKPLICIIDENGIELASVGENGTLDGDLIYGVGDDLTGKLFHPGLRGRPPLPTIELEPDFDVWFDEDNP